MSKEIIKRLALVLCAVILIIAAAPIVLVLLSKIGSYIG